MTRTNTLKGACDHEIIRGLATTGKIARTMRHDRMLGARLGVLLIYARARQPHTGHRHVTTAQMTEDRTPDAVPGIVASGREITRDDVEMLWSDLISGHYTWQETSERALVLIETVSVPEHIVNWGLIELYDLRRPGAARDAESHRTKREAWRAKLREYDADRDGWNRTYYCDMLVHHADRFGYDKAARFGRRLAAAGLLQDSDVDATLHDLRGATEAGHERSIET